MSLPWALRTGVDETGAPLIPKRFRIEFLARRREFITQRRGRRVAARDARSSASGCGGLACS
jgi:hypothetical protein